MFEPILSRLPLFALCFARCFAMISTTPILSSQAVSRIAKIALSAYLSFLALPAANVSAAQAASLDFIALVAGEALIGAITGFCVSLFFAAASSAGQFFSMQMGFGAAEAYDALAQVENPLMGQFFNLIAVLVFLQTKCLQTLFLGGFFRSIQSVSATAVASCRGEFLKFLISSLSELFMSALMISLPIIGALFVVTLCNGLLSKAAPQMNLLAEGYPITICCTFLLIFILLPILVNFFDSSFERAFFRIESLFARVGRQL